VRKRSKYKPKGVRPDAVSWVLSGLKPFKASPHELNLRIKNHDALNTVRLGTATRTDLDALIAAMNMAEALIRMGVGSDWSVEIRSAQDALYYLARRGVENNERFILTGSELKALNLGMEIHDAQLDACTIQMLEQAIDIVTADIKNRKARPITEIKNGHDRHPQTA
jgi:hypothetical protein